jgi:hypothetical protein
VFDTGVGDPGLQHLHGLTNLEIVLVGRSKVTDQGKESLSKARPGIRFTDQT